MQKRVIARTIRTRKTYLLHRWMDGLVDRMMHFYSEGWTGRSDGGMDGWIDG